MRDIKNGKTKRVLVAMSGGVDSSVAAALLKKQGYFVIGIFMKFWVPAGGTQNNTEKDAKQHKIENRCCSTESEKMARLVAKKIGIPFYALNAEREFKKKVVDYFLLEYKKGNTPNPCVVCNKEIKFGFLIKKALSLGADYVATGHYVAVKNGKLFKAADKNKDQSYFLWQLNQKQLEKVLFPLADYTKPEVRKLAKKFKLPTAEAKESQEICFIQNTTNEFLNKYLKIKPGNIIDKSGKILGRHQGMWFYTIGQRKGIGFSGGPYYVVRKDFKKNNLIISKSKKDLLQKELIAKNVNWTSHQKLPLNCEVKIRYKSNSATAKIYKLGAKKIKVIFEKPQAAVTPGQSAVFYAGRELLGGGIIE